ncbi:MAG: branched-chain amino acid ABC transporter permease [Halodesulfurarchaeum sp.]
MVDFNQVLQVVVFGLVQGSVLAVGAVGLTLSYGVTRFINFAYGEFMTYSLYVVVFLTGAGVGVSVPLPVAAVIAVLLVGLLGVAVARVFFEPIADRGSLPLLITSIGVGFLLRYALQAWVGVDAKQLPVPLMRPVEVFGVGMTPVEAVVVGISAGSMLVIHGMLQWTMIGKKMRAISGNRDLAEVAGIDTDRIVRQTWFVSAGAAGLAGVLYGVLFSPFRPSVGFEYLIVVFAATLLGGIGRPYGAMLGAYLIALTMSFGSFYLAASYTRAYAFAVLVLVLLLRPEGIRGGEF